MIRFAKPKMISGMAALLVVGMSTSGVASTFRPAAVREVARELALDLARDSVRKDDSKDATVKSQTDTVSTVTTAPTVQVGDGVEISKKPSREELQGLKALELVRFDWRTALPGWTIRFLPAKRGYLALTYREQRRIDVYVRLDRSSTATAHDVSHELGHAVDVTYLNDARRAAILKVRQLPEATNWWACNACTDLETGAGDFAETFAMIAAPRFKFYSELGDKPTPEMLRDVEAIVNSAVAEG